MDSNRDLFGILITVALAAGNGRQFHFIIGHLTLSDHIITRSQVLQNNRPAVVSTLAISLSAIDNISCRAAILKVNSYIMGFFRCTGTCHTFDGKCVITFGHVGGVVRPVQSDNFGQGKCALPLHGVGDVQSVAIQIILSNQQQLVAVVSKGDGSNLLKAGFVNGCHIVVVRIAVHVARLEVPECLLPGGRCVVLIEDDGLLPVAAGSEDILHIFLVGRCGRQISGNICRFLRFGISHSVCICRVGLVNLLGVICCGAQSCALWCTQGAGHMERVGRSYGCAAYETILLGHLISIDCNYQFTIFHGIEIHMITMPVGISSIVTC